MKFSIREACDTMGMGVAGLLWGVIVVVWLSLYIILAGILEGVFPAVGIDLKYAKLLTQLLPIVLMPAVYYLCFSPARLPQVRTGRRLGVAVGISQSLVVMGIAYWLNDLDKMVTEQIFAGIENPAKVLSGISLLGQLFCFFATATTLGIIEVNRESMYTDRLVKDTNGQKERAT